MGFEVEGQVFDGQGARMVLHLGPPRYRFDPCNQLVHLERLCEVIVRPEIESGDLVGRRMETAEEDDREWIFPCAQLPHEFESGHLRKLDVDHGDVVFVPGHLLYGVFSAGGDLAPPSSPGQSKVDELGFSIAVFNYKYVHACIIHEFPSARPNLAKK